MRSNNKKGADVKNLTFSNVIGVTMMVSAFVLGEETKDVFLYCSYAAVLVSIICDTIEKKLKGWLMRDYIMKVIYDLIK